MMEVRVIDHAQTHNLRHRVLWPHIQKTEDCVIDIDQRVDAIHLGVYSGGRLISIGSLFEMQSPKIQYSRQYRLRAMATDPEFRHLHSGKMLVEEAIQKLRAMGVEVLWCDARLNAVGFYTKLGFEMLPEVYEVKNIGPHHFMWFEIDRG